MRFPPTGPGREDSGFTLIELTVALSLIGGVLVAFAALMTGSLTALGASKQRSAMTEVLNGEIERHRSTKYDEVGVLLTDTALLTQYGTGLKYGGRDAVIATGSAVLPAVTNYPAGLPVPYRIERWVTWTDTAGGTTHQFKRIDLRVTWKENGRVSRNISFSTVVYPGGLGPPVAANSPPAAIFTASNTNPAIGENVTFTAIAADPDGDALTYNWSFGDGAVSTAGGTVTHSYSTAGSFSVALTVSDPSGATAAPSPVSITVASPVNQPPVITSMTVSGVGTRTDLINATATATDPEGDALTYTWNWGDSTADDTGNNVGHAYASTGSMVITLTVRDASLSVSDTRSWAVTALACSLKTGGASFANPTGATPNFIELGTGSKANEPRHNNLRFRVEVVNGSACAGTTIQGRIPTTTSTLTIALSRESPSSDFWSGTANNMKSLQINSANAQTAEVWTPADSGSGQKSSFSFDAYAL